MNYENRASFRLLYESQETIMRLHASATGCDHKHDHYVHNSTLCNTFDCFLSEGSLLRNSTLAYYIKL